jgi:hypothetical protein
MVAVSSSWLVASGPVPLITAEVGGASIDMPAGDYYLRHATASLSLLDAVAAAASALTGDTHTLVVIRNRRVRWSATGGNWDVDFSTGNGAILAALLGASTVLPYSGSASYTFDEIPPWLWSPGWLATPQTIAGKAGYSVDHKKRYKSDDGQRSFTHYLGSETWQELELDHVVSSRMCLADSVSLAARGGTFDQFYEQSAKLGYQFFHYEQVTEDSADATTPVTWPTGFGPYVLRPEFKGRWNERRVQGADVSNRLRLPIHMVREYS